MRAPSFWKHRGIVARLLSPLGWLHNGAVAAKAAHASPYRASMPVICVGNLTAGGSGKTPVAIAVAEALKARGKQPVFLTRGYGGKARGPLLVRPHHSARLVGDEALLLARVAPTILARDRPIGAAMAADQKADVIVMDDGHQNFSLAKDLSLVVVDGGGGFGNGLVLPAGPLREKVAQGLERADAVVVMGSGMPALEGYGGPALRARLEPVSREFAGRKVVAFAGIGRPQKFFDTLTAMGAILRDSESYGDHYFYFPADLDGLRARAQGDPLVTTEKDFVRIPPELRHGICVLAVKTRFDDPVSFEALLAKAVP
jgi:tetraacyldisaccharide 4'-kinase